MYGSGLSHPLLLKNGEIREKQRPECNMARINLFSCWCNIFSSNPDTDLPTTARSTLWAAL
jgi:hypothetical protein